MKRSGIRNNNRGDSLILVIGCIALLSIIGVVLLAKTMDNRSMKVAEEQAQASFAGAETGSAEMVAVIEDVALDVIEDAFVDMLLEYSLLANDDERKDRYNKYFRDKVEDLLSTGGELQDKLEDALGGTAVTNLTVEHFGGVSTEASEEGYTDTVRVKEVVFTYTTAGSQSKITTDICVMALKPDVKAGFNSGISCDFTDFALISDGSVNNVTEVNNMEITGNLYTGGDLVTSGSSSSSVDTKVKQATKLLVKNEIKVVGNAGLWVDAAGVSISEGEGLWAGGISMSGGTLDTTNVNLYVQDDLAVEGTSPKVVLKGGSAEYVGYSGDKTALINHEKSSAITVNESTNPVLDMSALGNLYINGNSYICENNNNWGDGFVDGTTEMKPAMGILQGESIAYKDMQAMYLFPGSCLPNHSHNPIIGNNVTVGTPSLTYKFRREGSAEQTMDLGLYVDNENPYVTRTARLDGGATVATYVYLNFKSEEAAAQYVKDYLNTFLGDSIKQQITNLGSAGRIILPTDTYTLSNAISYDGTGLTMRPAADGIGKAKLDIASIMAEQRYEGLFSSLRAEGAAVEIADYDMVEDGIVNMTAVNAVASGEGITIPVTVPSGPTYHFYVHNGNLTVNAGNDYDGKKGILLVNGDLNIATTSLTMEGLVLVTGEVTQGAGLRLTANKDVVETLLANEDVAKYFRVYGEESGQGYLSTEAIKISFDKWEKN